MPNPLRPETLSLLTPKPRPENVFVNHNPLFFSPALFIPEETTTWGQKGLMSSGERRRCAAVRINWPLNETNGVIGDDSRSTVKQVAQGQARALCFDDKQNHDAYSKISALGASIDTWVMQMLT